MIVTTQIQGRTYTADLHAPIDISMPLHEGMDTVNCFWAPYFEAVPVRMGNWVGDTRQGSSVNFKTVKFTPHGNGTHTECVGHIAQEAYTINKSLKQFHFLAQLLTVYPQQQADGDRVITLQQIQEAFTPGVQAIVIRTMPNDDIKLRTNYSGANPPYIAADAVAYLVEQGIEHLLIDLPSVDRADDGGRLAAHKAFWKYPQNVRTNATITELIYVENRITDGWYLLNIQIASFEIDASPSKPVLYALQPTDS